MARPAPTSIRFPDPLREEIALTAAAERRSFGIRLLVEDGLRARQADEELLQQLRQGRGEGHGDHA